MIWYQNQEKGFAFSYPSEWGRLKTTQKPEGIEFFSPEKNASFAVLFIEKPSTQKLDAYNGKKYFFATEKDIFRSIIGNIQYF